jgi:hypothetical protein
MVCNVKLSISHVLCIGREAFAWGTSGIDCVYLEGGIWVRYTILKRNQFCLFCWVWFVPHPQFSCYTHATWFACFPHKLYACFQSSRWIFWKSSLRTGKGMDVFIEGFFDWFYDLLKAAVLHQNWFFDFWEPLIKGVYTQTLTTSSFFEK